MTTLAIRSPLHIITMGASGKRRKVAYDEEDDGFMFTRTRSKAKAAAAAPPPRVQEKASEEVGDQEPIQVPTPPAKEKRKTTAKTTRSSRAKEAASEEQDAKERKENEAPVEKNNSTRTRPAIDAHSPKSSREKKGKRVFTTPVTKKTAAVMPRRKSARLSGEAAQLLSEPQQQQQQQQQQSKPRTRRSLVKAAHEEREPEPQPPAVPAEPEVAAVAAKGAAPANERRVGGKDSTPPVFERSNETKIALPFADTPVIKRNKELRKGGSQGGHRRSSVGMRGRRASSLIDSGTSSAMPHREVGEADFYKHIEGEGLPEPRRMRQLLMWCATRALGDKPSYSTGDGNARLAARVIQEELLKDFSNRGDLSDWFSRDEDSAPAVVVKKPNPRNEANAAKVQELEADLKRIKQERKAWEALNKPPDHTPLPAPSVPPDAHPAASSTASLSNQPTSSSSSSSAPSTIPTLPSTTPTLPSSSTSSSSTAPRLPPPSTIPTSTPASTSTAPSTIDPSLLDPEQANFLTSLTAHPDTGDSTQHHLHDLASGLEFKVDLLAEGLHHLSQYRETADHVASRVLALAADRLEQRDVQGKEASGTRDVSTQDVLRALSRVDR
ncbi:hypothetical protein L228DRAFT_263512 [Xylona heveae TC161]|uniref:Mis12-Mtw1 protein n=1 Tax=Xylona heveae (strain CBS 132557 / TC161) TaxID=1328760 RepID=A0A164ZX35_XYLHT|nr:hypothetical protein L228DRAFT_263512 [Xylona heveae TC161]KZF19645.1 hypothetical protein L228DRAFT_263512 [Xylona heveae TC161]